MKRLLILGLLIMLAACEGRMGPTGPQGTVDVQRIHGIIAHHFYARDDTLRIGNDFIQLCDVVDLVVKPTPEAAWIQIPGIVIYNKGVGTYDPARQWIGYEYELRIINLPQP